MWRKADRSLILGKRVKRRVLAIPLMLIAGCITDGSGGNGTGQPIPGSGLFSARVVNDSTQDADVTLQFMLDGAVVHRTRLRRVRPDTSVPIAGPERAHRLMADGTREDGTSLPEMEFVFGVDVDEGGEVIYLIVDADDGGGVPNPLPDTDTNGPPDMNTDGMPDVDTNGPVDPPPGGGGGGGGGGVDPPTQDCNGNDIDDDDEIAEGAPDCNGNQVLDECDLSAETSLDLNENGLPDECEPDCNANQVPDDLDLLEGVSFDCNENLVPDECDIAGCTSFDCNENTVPDACDITAGSSDDTDENGIPDECRRPAGDCDFNLLVTVDDWRLIVETGCVSGPQDIQPTLRGKCFCGDFDDDNDIDLRDMAEFQRALSTCPVPDASQPPQ